MPTMGISTQVEAFISFTTYSCVVMIKWVTMQRYVFLFALQACNLDTMGQRALVSNIGRFSEGTLNLQRGGLCDTYVGTEHAEFCELSAGLATEVVVKM